METKGIIDVFWHLKNLLATKPKELVANGPQRKNLTWKVALILIFHPLTTYEKASFIE